MPDSSSMALMQVLGVGTVALMAHAVGRKDRDDANLVFNQAIVLSVLFGLLTLVVGAVLARPYMRAVAADEATVEAGTTLSVVVHAGAGAAIRDAGDGGRAARHRHRAADHAGAGARGDHQHRAGAGADRGLGHRPRARRCRCRPGEFDRRPDRRADAVCVFPQVRALRRLRAGAMASAAAGNGSASSMSVCPPAASSRSSSPGWA